MLEGTDGTHDLIKFGETWGKSALVKMVKVATARGDFVFS